MTWLKLVCVSCRLPMLKKIEQPSILQARYKCTNCGQLHTWSRGSNYVSHLIAIGPHRIILKAMTGAKYPWKHRLMRP